MPTESLKNTTINGTIWSAADAFLGQGVSFIVGIILARLLSPDEYGLVGICLIFNTILNGVVDSGFSNALIRKKDCTNDDYNTMFITNFVVSIVLYVILYSCTPYVADFFGREELSVIVRVTSFVLILNAISITHVTILTKRIDFKTKTKASLFSALISGIIGVSMAFTGFGVWALVGQMLARQLFYSLFLWIFIRWYPNFKFSIGSFYYMWGFGWKIMLSGLINNIWNQLYQVVVGKFYSSATLGQYTRSRQYAGLFSENLTTIIQRVTYPALANIQNEKERMAVAYRKVIKTTMLVTTVCMIWLGAMSEPFIYCLIGPQWQEAASYLPLICISMSLYPLHAINLNMLQIQGRSDIFLNLEIIKKIISIAPICLGIFIDIYWMLAGSIISGIISFFLNSHYTGKNLGYSSWQQLKDVAPSYGVATIIAVSVYFFKYLSCSYWIVLPLQLCVGTIALIVFCELIKLEEYKEVKRIILNEVIKIRK